MPNVNPSWDNLFSISSNTLFCGQADLITSGLSVDKYPSVFMFAFFRTLMASGDNSRSSTLIPSNFLSFFSSSS